MATGTSLEVVSEIKQHLLKCNICLKRLNSPRSLPCLHSFCTGCLETLAEANGANAIECPQCRAVTELPQGSVHSFPVAFHLNYISETIALFQCCNKEDDNLHDPPTVKCIECDAYYCNSCIGAHKLVAQTKQHTQVMLKDLCPEVLIRSAQGKVSLCDIHPESPLKYFCLHDACNTPICPDCRAVNHNDHEIIELVKKATKYRTENAKVIDEDMQESEVNLQRLKENIKIAKEENHKQHEQNMAIIKERSQKMYKMLKEQENALLEEESKMQETLLDYYTNVEQNTDEKLTSLQRSKMELESMNNASPDDEITKKYKAMQKKAKSVLVEALPPELLVQTVSVTSEGSPVVEMKQIVVKGKEVRCENALDGPIDSVVKLTDLTIALHWHGDARASDVYVKSSKTMKAKRLKEVIEKHCRQAYRVVPMTKDGKERVVIRCTEADKSRKIKILHVEKEEVEDLGIDPRHNPYAIAVDEDNNIFYTTNTTPNTIRKRTDNETKTLFTDQQGNEILSAPWYLAVNTNGSVVVSDYTKKSVIVINKMGKLVNKYEHFTLKEGKNPVGVCTGYDGRIYVSDFSGDRIRCLDKSGNFLYSVVKREDGLQNPTALQFYDGVLVVGQANGQIKYYKIL